MTHVKGFSLLKSYCNSFLYSQARFIMNDYEEYFNLFLKVSNKNGCYGFEHSFPLYISLVL